MPERKNKNNNEPTFNKAKAEVENKQNSEQDFTTEFSNEFRTRDSSPNNNSRNKKNDRKKHDDNNNYTEFASEIANENHSFPDYVNDLPSKTEYETKHPKPADHKNDDNFYKKHNNNKANKLF